MHINIDNKKTYNFTLYKQKKLNPYSLIIPNTILTILNKILINKKSLIIRTKSNNKN